MTAVEQSVRDHLAAGAPDEAAEAAIRGFGPEILGFLRSVLRDETDASDAFSLFAEWIWRGLPGFEGNSSLRTWAYRIAWSAAGRFLRDPYRRRRNRLPTSAASRLAASLCASTALARRDERDAVQRLRERLTPEEQTLLVLRVDRELSWDEVAEVLGADGPGPTAAALRKQYERLRDKLARLARDEGLIA